MGWIGPINDSAHMHRTDLSSSILIFGGLLLTAIAICGALDATPSTRSTIEEVRVMVDQAVIDPKSIDLQAVECSRSDSKSQRCREKATVMQTVVF